MSSLVVPYDPSSKPAHGLWAKAAPSLGDSANKVGTTRVFFDDEITAISSLGKEFAKSSGDAKRELVRKSVGSGVKALKVMDGDSAKNLVVDTKNVDAHAAAVAAHLAAYTFTLKTEPKSLRFDPRKKSIEEDITIKPSENSEEWQRGYVYAYAQNLARTLKELPANVITPTEFCNRAKKEFEGIDNVEIIVRDEKWAEEKGMRTFLSVTHGTSEPAKVLEIHYKGAPSKDAPPVAFVGKGITFDSGGISLKPGDGMKAMRADMGGAAAVTSAALAIAKLKIPVNLVVVCPLTENMPGPSATKPGDIIYAMNGKSVEVDNTDAEGRLILSDAIYYASTEYKPHSLIDVATLTGAMMVAVGELYTGVFSNSDELWQQLHTAGEHEFDKFWRMPLDEDYGPQIYSSNADLCNSGGRIAGSCTAALFLKNFVDVEKVKWAHLDIAGVMESTRPLPYQEKGMTGRPVRGLVEYVRRLSQAA